jgi:hypothetical protein
MLDIDETILGAADDWFILAADDVTRDRDSDDAAFDRWLATLPEGGLDDTVNMLLDSEAGPLFDRGSRPSVRSGRR